MTDILTLFALSAVEARLTLTGCTVSVTHAAVLTLQVVTTRDVTRRRHAGLAVAAGARAHRS